MLFELGTNVHILLNFAVVHGDCEVSIEVFFYEGLPKKHLKKYWVLKLKKLFLIVKTPQSPALGIRILYNWFFQG